MYNTARSASLGRGPRLAPSSPLTLGGHTADFLDTQAHFLNTDLATFPSYDPVIDLCVVRAKIHGWAEGGGRWTTPIFLTHTPIFLTQIFLSLRPRDRVVRVVQERNIAQSRSRSERLADVFCYISCAARARQIVLSGIRG